VEFMRVFTAGVHNECFYACRAHRRCRMTLIRMTGASIIIPVYNALEFTRASVASIYDARTSVPFEVIVVDNGSNPEVGDWFAREQKQHQHLVVVRFDQPLGFARAVNEGARRARHDTLVLLNSDTVVTDGWLDGLRDALLSDSRLGVVSPLTNYAGNPLQVDPETKSFHPRQARRYAAKIHNRKELIYEPERVAFFCVMIRRELWRLLAGLEEGYGVGNGEDNDFCLRARLAGYRLAVARNVFVFHHPGHATFRANALDRDAWIARGQLLSCERASHWARSLEFSDRRGTQSLPNLSVIVPVMHGQVEGLGDSLTSLANQTVRGFETIIVSPAGAEISNVVHGFDGRLRMSSIRIDEARRDQPAALLNAGLAAANQQWIAYLPAGDIYYPFHIELLAEALRDSQAEAVYAAWSAVDRAIQPGNGRKRRGVVATYRPTPGDLGLDNYPPLPCWMHIRAGVPGVGFDESFRALADWEFVLRMSKRAKVRYVPRVTCERRIGPERTAVDPLAVGEARRMMQSLPVDQPWQQENRIRFLEAVERGTSEWFPLLTPDPSLQPVGRKSGAARSTGDRMSRTRSLQQLPYRAARGTYRALVPLHIRQKIKRRTRQLLGSPPIQRTDTQRLQCASDALAKAILDTKWIPHPPGAPDILFFSVVPWDHLVQRPHHFARELALRGHRVFWVDLRLKPPELVDPASLPQELEPGVFYIELPGTVGELYQLKWDGTVLATMEMAVAHIRAACGIQHAIQLVNRPKWAPLAFRLRDRYGWPIVYDCVDDTKAFAAMNGHDGGAFEDELAERCDLLVACSRLLYEDRCKLNPNTIQILNAGDYDLFHSAVPAGLLNHLPHPIVGFFGALSEWIDLDWVGEAARRFPHWSFVYIGRSGFASAAKRERWKTLTSAANIHVFPQADPQKLAAYLAEFDVCTMPFRDLPMTRIMNAVKIYEYLAAGKAVVISNIAELEPVAERGLIAMYRDYEQSFQLLEEASTPPTPDQTAARLAFAAQNTWVKRVDELTAAFLTLGHPRLDTSSGSALEIKRPVDVQEVIQGTEE
jgi:GT2 family glycosyltransferase/glycosyltransferase involved in cell wall biosynthesis